MSIRALWLLPWALVALLIGVAPAPASLSGELSAGRAVAAKVQGGKTGCMDLSATGFERLGEYVMDRMVGSRAAHAAMNQRMTEAIGTGNTERMHEVMGRRFARCAVGGAGGVPMGPWMMGGAYGDGGGGGMMGSAGWGWMHNGAWQHMSRRQWRDLAGTMMGARYVTPGHHGWSIVGVLALALGALVVGAAIAVVAVRRPWRRGPPTASSAP